MELTAIPAQTLTQILYLRNKSKDINRMIDLQVVELGQWENGRWRLIDPNSPPDDIIISTLNSCRQWIKLDKYKTSVPALTTVPIRITIKVPHSVRGVYYAGLTARIGSPDDIEGVGIAVKFLVPILIEIQGMTVRHKIGISDVGMEFLPQQERSPSMTLSSIRIANLGNTYSKLQGSLIIKHFSNGHWREVTTTNYKEVGILPGNTLNLRADIGRNLPSGTYNLTGKLYVDGRRAKPLEKEIQFIGDPNVNTVLTDAAIKLEPDELFLKSVPGATRSAVLKVRNASDADVLVTAAATIPQALSGVAFGDLRGEELACHKWLKVEPEKFTLRSGRQKNIRIVSKMPEGENLHPNYYAKLGLWARYSDGQNAGVITSLIGIENSQAKSRPAAQPIKLTMAIEEKSEYVIVSRFVNMGNVHIKPKCSINLLTQEGKIIKRVSLTSDVTLMLPMEICSFSGILDFADIKAGNYYVESILGYPLTEKLTERINQTITVRISDESGQKIVEIIGPQEIAAK